MGRFAEVELRVGKENFFSGGLVGLLPTDSCEETITG